VTDEFTLVIPTYERSKELARLLTFLERCGFEHAVLVLDSSREPARAANACAITARKLRIERHEFDPSMRPFDKFAAGAALVGTPFAALCGDDDVLLPDALPTLLGHLREAPCCAAVHGWYFGFQPFGERFDLLDMVYRSESIDGATPIDRLAGLLANYQAAIYAVYRTTVLQRALAAFRDLDSPMFRELGTAALTAISGSIERLPIVYYGRMIGRSQNYVDWHPTEYLLRSPERLIRQYAAYRVILLAELAKTEADLDTTAALVDLVHLRYLTDYLQPAVLDYIIKIRPRALDTAQTLDGIWGLYTRPEPFPLRQLRSLRGFQWVRRRTSLESRHRLARLLRLIRPDRNVSAVTASGASRSYRLQGRFLRAITALPHANEKLAALLEALARFE
jgi:glycosyltransferase domain-containing protein